MRLWLATTTPDTAIEAFTLGLFDGVLTNPTLVAAAERPVLELFRDLCAATPGPVFYQLRHDSFERMKAEASGLLEQGWENLGIKVALTRDGCQMLEWLRSQEVPLRLATAVPTVASLLLATALEVPWVTPSSSFLANRGGPSKLDLLTDMQTAIDRQAAGTVLIPSLSSPDDLQTLGLRGIRAGFVWDHALSSFAESAYVQEIVSGFDAAWSTIEAREKTTL